MSFTFAVQCTTELALLGDLSPVQASGQRLMPYVRSRGKRDRAPQNSSTTCTRKNVDGRGPEKPSMAVGGCVHDSTTKAILGGLSTQH